MLSYELNHSDGRTSFPLVLINWAPITSEIGLLTLHASALLNFQTTVGPVTMSIGPLTLISLPQADVSKIIEIRDGPEGLTKEAIDAKLLSK